MLLSSWNTENSVISGNADDRHSLFRSGHMDMDTNVSNAFLWVTNLITLFNFDIVLFF